jgi:hypothetical protein
MEGSARFIECLAYVWILAEVSKELEAEQYIFVSVRARIGIAVMVVRRPP